MRRLPNYLRWGARALLLGGMLLVTACAAKETPPPSTPTPELSVVVFATATSTPALAETATPTSPPPAATVGFGAPTAAASVSAAVDSLPANRPADVNPLTGFQVKDPSLLRRRPLLVRVGNDPGARPQVGLSEADVVYEELTEGWITRFTAIYLSQDPAMIAPIRSARLVNVQLTPQYQGALASSGGSDPVRWELSQTDLVNLDEFFTPLPYFYRETENWQTRLAFDATVAREYLADEGLESDVGLRGFVFSEKLDSALKAAEAKEVVIPYPWQTSEAKWQYDPAGGKYLRFTTGEPMMDFAGQQIAAANVIIYFAEHQDTDIVEDSNGATSIRIMVNGKGPAWLLRDGRLVKGTWETNGRETPSFTLDGGQPMALKPGNTWIELVPLEYVINVDGAEQGLESAAAETSPDKSTPAPATTPTLTPTPIGARQQATAAPTPGN